MRRLVLASAFPALGAVLVTMTLSALACGGDSAPATAVPAGTAAAPDASAPSSPPPSASSPSPARAVSTKPAAGGGQDFGMVSSRGQQVTDGGGGDGGSGGISFSFPQSWREEPPSSSMRMAQAVIPGPGGDGQLTVFFFGVGGGGGVEANLQRWVGQVQANAGEEPLQETFDTGSFKVHYIEIGGTMLPSQMGTGPTTAQPGQRLLGAVVEGPGGPWFFKATGPEATMATERDAFKKMLRELEPGE